MYKKTQYSGIMIAIPLISMGLLLAAYLLQWGKEPIPEIYFYALEIFFLILGSLFFRLKITVKNKKIRLIYGIGIIQICIKPTKINAVETVKISLWYSLGIRVTAKGMLYGVQGRDAVRIDYETAKKKKSIRIGTKDAENLKEAITKEF